MVPKDTTTDWPAPTVIGLAAAGDDRLSSRNAEREQKSKGSGHRLPHALGLTGEGNRQAGAVAPPLLDMEDGDRAIVLQKLQRD